MALQIPGTKPVSSELAFPSSEPGRSHVLESVPTLPGSEEAGVSFDLPAQADTLHSANKVINCLLFVFLLTRPTLLLLYRAVCTADVIDFTAPCRIHLIFLPLTSLQFLNCAPYFLLPTFVLIVLLIIKSLQPEVQSPGLPPLFPWYIPLLFTGPGASPRML